MKNKKLQDRHARMRRIRGRVTGTAERPRLSVFRSLKALTVQIIDDTAGRTIAYASTREVKVAATKEGAKKLGQLIAGKAKEKKVTAIVFDRGGYKYHGRVKEIADAAREAGLQF